MTMYQSMFSCLQSTGKLQKTFQSWEAAGVCAKHLLGGADGSLLTATHLRNSVKQCLAEG